METKTFEILDRATFIPAMGTKMIDDAHLRNKYLLERAGYSHNISPLIFLVIMSSRPQEGTYDNVDWLKSGTRTMHVAHKYIEENWDSLASGSVIDVEFILGETEIPKDSELLTDPPPISREEFEEFLKDCQVISL